MTHLLNSPSFQPHTGPIVSGPPARSHLPTPILPNNGPPKRPAAPSVMTPPVCTARPDQPPARPAAAGARALAGGGAQTKDPLCSGFPGFGSRRPGRMRLQKRPIGQLSSCHSSSRHQTVLSRGCFLVPYTSLAVLRSDRPPALLTAATPTQPARPPHNSTPLPQCAPPSSPLPSWPSFPLPSLPPARRCLLGESQPLDLSRTKAV